MPRLSQDRRIAASRKQGVQTAAVQTSYSSSSLTRTCGRLKKAIQIRLFLLTLIINELSKLFWNTTHTVCQSRHASSPQPLSDTDPLLENEKSSSRALEMNSEKINHEKKAVGLSISPNHVVVITLDQLGLLQRLTRLKERNVPIFGHWIGRDLERWNNL